MRTSRPSLLCLTLLLVASQCAIAATNIAPSVNWVRPTNGTIFTVGSPILLRVTAVDQDGAVSFVDFFANSTNQSIYVGRASAATNVYSVVWSNAPAGTFQLQAEAVDNDGGRGSAFVNILIRGTNQPPPSNSLPVATWIRPTNGASFQTGNSILLTARATDSDGSVSFVDFFADASMLGRVFGPSTNALYNFLWTNPPAGTFQLHAEAVDNAGARGISDVAQIVVGGGSTNPVVTWITPADGASFPAGSPILLRAHATDPDGTVSFVDFFDDANRLARVFTASSNVYSFVWSNAPVGMHLLRAEAVDNDGASGVAGVQITVRDGGTNQPPTNAAPVVDWVSPPDGAGFPAGSTILLTAHATDSDGTVSFVDFFANSNLLGRVVTPATNNFYNFRWSNAPAGNFRLHAEAVDNAGARGISGSVQIVVGGGTNQPPTNMPPVVTWVQPTNGSTFPAGSRISLRARATDSDGTVSFVEFFATPTNGPSMNVGRGTLASSDGLYIAGWTNPPAGQYRLHAEAVDNAGARGISDPVQIVVNGGGTNQPPTNTPPVATWLDPGNGTTFTAPGPILLRAQATDSDGTVSFVEFFANSNRLGAASSVSNIYQFVWSNTPPGNFQLHAEAVDNAGARGISDSVQIVVNGGGTNQPPSNSPPTIVSQPRSQTVLEGADVILSTRAIGTAPLSYQWFKDGAEIPGFTSPTQRLSSVTTSDGGVYWVVVTNPFGSARSSNAVLTVIPPGSNSPPVVSLLSPTNGSVFRSRQPIFLRAFASDADGSVSFVDFFANTTRVARAFSFGGTNFTSVWSNAPAGRYDIRAVATDNLGAQAVSETASITVLSNRPPVANDLTVTLEENSSRNIALSGSDPDGDSLVFTVLTQPAHGTLSGSSQMVFYSPNPNYTGPDSFTFSVRDREFESAPATVQITVLSENHPPVIQIDLPGSVIYFGGPVFIALPDPNFDNRANKGEPAPILPVTVVLDGSQSFDPDGDPLQFAWSTGDNGEPFSSGIRVTNELSPGVYVFLLTLVDRPLSSITDSIRVDVLTPCDAITYLFERIGTSRLSRGDQRPLMQALVMSCDDFESGDIASGLERLQAFQRKVTAKVPQIDPELARLLIDETQALIDAIQTR